MTNKRYSLEEALRAVTSICGPELADWVDNGPDREGKMTALYGYAVLLLCADVELVLSGAEETVKLVQQARAKGLLEQHQTRH